MKLKETGGTYEQPEPGSYAAVCFRFIDIGTQSSEFNGETKIQHKIIIAWELDEKMKDGKPFSISEFYTASLHEKSKLRAHLEAWRGRQLTKEELEGFDTKEVLGKPCMLSLVKNEKGKIELASVSKMPKGMIVPALVNPTVYFSLEEFDKGVFDGLSDGYKRLIMKSPEYQAIVNPGAVPEPVPAGGGMDAVLAAEEPPAEAW
jgi:hypothetical protein